MPSQLEKTATRVLPCLPAQKKKEMPLFPYHGPNFGATLVCATRLKKTGGQRKTESSGPCNKQYVFALTLLFSSVVSRSASSLVPKHRCHHQCSSSAHTEVFNTQLGTRRPSWQCLAPERREKKRWGSAEVGGGNLYVWRPTSDLLSNDAPSVLVSFSFCRSDTNIRHESAAAKLTIYRLGIHLFLR